MPALPRLFTDFGPDYPRSGRTSTQQTPAKKQSPPQAPEGLREKYPIFGVLPKYTGPYDVGTMEIEVPARSPRAFSDITRNNVHVLTLETILIMIYYPAHLDTRINPLLPTARQKFRPLWLARPRTLTSCGYAHFANLPQWSTMLLFLCTTWFTKLPAYKNAKLADHWPKSCTNENQQPELSRIATRGRGNPPLDGPDKPLFPLMILSHGLGSTKTSHSTLCGEFASHGFVICAIEHRDRSAARTLVNHTRQGLGSREERELSGRLKHTEADKAKTFDTIDYLFPKHDKMDTTPGHDIDKELRNAQLEFRAAEIDEAYQLLKELCAGRGEKIAEQNLRGKGAAGGSELALQGCDWLSWKDAFSLKNVTMAGHSFGGATTVQVLRQHSKFPYIGQGIIFDIWGMPLQPAPKEDLTKHIHVPLLSINSEAFMYWPDNFKVAKAIIQEAEAQNQPAWLITIRGTVHVSQTDFCLLYPTLAALVMKTTINPVRAIDLNVDASLDFLNRTYPAGHQPFRCTLPSHRILDSDLVVNTPVEHRPENRLIAFALKVRRGERRKVIYTRQRKSWKRLHAPGSDEVWIHIAPGTKAVDIDLDPITESPDEDHMADKSIG